ncbi:MULTISPECIES: hypothetical protein [Sporosarcina]|uniref:hypothetical protein n=1 Tax=Sporosarcina TaxID=1569 RepID=UPI001C8D07CA|nr:hypothetical protein [Sporosarcina aquimarina]MBY0223276.1 hypothetical protein [Sporosarcina aquimarina]
MKRYWKIISICLVIVLSIGTFYIQSSFATNNHVEIEFKKISGNENEVKNLILTGDYQAGDRSQSLQITNEKTIDPNHLPFLKKIERMSVPPTLEGLVKERRSFMRSKDLTANHFFEDKNTVAYARIQAENFYEQPMKELTFEIEVLNKKSEKITSLELDVPEREKYSWMSVEKVQVIEGELKIITHNLLMDGRGEFHAYTVNLKGQKLVHNDTIASTPTVEYGWTDIRVINAGDYNEKSKYLLIHIEASEEKSMQDDGQPNIIANEYVVYDIENNQTKKLAVPDEILDSIGGASAVFHSTIFIPLQTANGIEVNQYDIENEKWDEKLIFDIADSTDDENPYLKVMNGRLYAVSATNKEHIFFIGDLETGESLYEGKLEVKSQRNKQEDYHLYIYEILEGADF